MPTEQITCTRKDEKGNITYLRNSQGILYSSGEVIRLIKAGLASFFVDVNGARAEVRVAGIYPNEYLRTTADTSTRNNLDNLPDC